MMPPSTLQELISRWHDLRQQGRIVAVDELCADCPEHLPQLKQHLEAVAAMMSFLGQTPDRSDTVTLRGPSSDHLALPSIPGHDILEEVGRGGMGVVYKARHLALQRFVAVKVLLAGTRADPDEIARFRAEAVKTARLQHPNIVQIHEVGGPDGLPYFSLELVPGGSLAKVLAERPLPPRQAATLVEVLARAIQHAHENGIIHRDLKPANVLLASGGREPPEELEVSGGSRPPLANYVPKITDFGLARLIETEPGQAPSGSVAGTPNYMAPEQAMGRTHDIGPVTDVYALGAILYECLTGRPPFTGATMLDVLLQVNSDDPCPPSRLQSKTPADLETICLKCLRKEPGKRYASALELAEDLQRFLEDRPIRARPVSVAERCRRWCRRNPRVAGLAVTLVLVVLGSLIGLTILWRHAVAQENTATRMARRVQESSRQLADLQHEFADLNSKTGMALVRTGDAAQAEQFYRKALDIQRKLIRDNPGVTEHIRAQADTYNSLGLLYSAMNKPDKAEAVLKQAVEEFRDLITAHPNVAYFDYALATCLNNLGLHFFETGHTEKAEETLLEALALQKKANGSNPPAEYRHSLARIQHNLARAYRRLDKLDDAETAFVDALRTWQELLQKQPNAVQYRHALAICRDNLGSLYTDRDKPAEAAQEYRESLALKEQLAREYPDVPDYRNGQAISLNNLARLDWDAQRWEAAEKGFGQVLAIRKELVAKYPSMAAYQEGLANTYLNLARSLLPQGRLADAVAACQESRKLWARNPKRLYEVASVLARVAAPARDGANEPEQEKAARSQAGALALDTLRQARTAGFRDWQALKTESEWAVLRDQEGFRQLLRDVEGP